MANTPETQAATTTNNNNINPFVFLSNIPKCLLNSLINFKNNFKINKQEKKVETQKPVTQEASIINFTKTPDVVRYPNPQQLDLPSLKLENEDVKDTNPIILWQVYALGGFIILKWAWGKWQERQAKKKDLPNEDEDENENENEDDPPAED